MFVRYSLDSAEINTPANKYVPVADYTIYVDLSGTIGGDGSSVYPYTFAQWQAFISTCPYPQGKILLVYLKGSVTSYTTPIQWSKLCTTFNTAWNPDVNGYWSIKTDVTFKDTGVFNSYIEGGVLFVENGLAVKQDFITTFDIFAFNNMFISAAVWQNRGSTDLSKPDWLRNRYNTFLVDEYQFSGAYLYDSCIVTPLMSGGGCECYNVAIDATVDTTGGNTYTNCDLLWNAAAVVWPSFTGSKNDFKASSLYSGINPVTSIGSDTTYLYGEAGLFGENRKGIGAGYFNIAYVQDVDDIAVSLKKSSSLHKYFTDIPPETFATSGSQGCIVKTFSNPVDQDAYGFGYKNSFIGSTKTFNWIVELNSIIEVEILRKKTYPKFVDIVLQGFFIYGEKTENIKGSAR
jgi:hypothetical protein